VLWEWPSLESWKIIVSFMKNVFDFYKKKNAYRAIAYLTISNEIKSSNPSYKIQCQIVLNWIFFLFDTTF